MLLSSPPSLGSDLYPLAAKVGAFLAYNAPTYTLLGAWQRAAGRGLTEQAAPMAWVDFCPSYWAPQLWERPGTRPITLAGGGYYAYFSLKNSFFFF